ncbi:probable pectinesterase/pectinesterase inhibitor 61 [Lactuca sativa]|uniref:probable pectinesterase/pectinesterase inhibitor 61 n=1 Tax=Lactuca sativa TaxID=4236 RepID=UPI000CD914B2|nr:probable pectinesterase/pectinesterase inhibitor 61 [Lactuca sativa]
MYVYIYIHSFSDLTLSIIIPKLILSLLQPIVQNLRIIMNYGRLEAKSQSDAELTQDHYATSSSEPLEPTPKRRSRLKLLLLIVGFTLIIASAVSVTLVVVLRSKDSGGGSGSMTHRQPTKAISRVCSRTLYQNLCVNSLVDFPGSLIASDKELVHISVNMTLHHVGKALYTSTDLSNLEMDGRARSAYNDCLELLEDSVDQLTRSLTSVAPSGDGDPQRLGSPEDVMTWLSASLTNQDTCTDGLSETEEGEVRNQMREKLKDLSELVSNSLAIYSSSDDDEDEDADGIPIQNRRRRRLMSSAEETSKLSPLPEFPVWVRKKERRLIQTPASLIQADIVVSQDGNGTCKTIKEAIKKAPENSNRRFIIYVKAGRYEEKELKVGRKKTNLMFIGDGMGKTVITGGVSVADNVTTFHTASFAATGAGFMARDITFENYAGAAKHQAVALRVGADKSVIYRCNIIGYQDSLYVHSQRQFYRECDIYGTVDFIFGNAAVVIQNCNIIARKPMDQQKVTITAQNRKDPNQNTGISIHSCKLLAQPDLLASKGSIQTFLGRPWKMYARTVYLLSYMGDHIDPKGWLEWDGSFALDTLYYGEYMNYGPGGAIGQRVKWPGYRVITSAIEANRFTVGKFIYGSSWLPATGVAFLAGLSE